MADATRGTFLGAPHIPRNPEKFDLLPKKPPLEPKAKSMISLFMHGGPSHVDLLDPKPELTKQDGKDYQGEVTYSFINRASKRLLGSPWKFEKRGQCGTEVSELLPGFSEIVDDAVVVHSMHTDINGHEADLVYEYGNGPARSSRAGSWLTYGLGSVSQDLPAYMVLSDPGGHPVDGVRNWSNGWMRFRCFKGPSFGRNAGS